MISRTRAAIDYFYWMTYMDMQLYHIIRLNGQLSIGDFLTFYRFTLKNMYHTIETFFIWRK